MKTNNLPEGVPLYSDDDDSHIGTGVYENIVREVSLDFTEMKVLAEQLDRKI